MGGPLSWAFGYAGERLLDWLISRGFKKDLPDRLRGVVQEWASALPDDLRVQPDALFPDVIDRSTQDAASVPAVRSLSQDQLPSVAEWVQTITLRCEFIKRQVTLAERQPFFVASDEKCQPAIEDLALRLHRECIQEDRLFKTQVLSELTEVRSMLNELLKTNATMRAEIPAPQDDLKTRLPAIAKDHGHSAGEVERTIRTSAAIASDPYDVGLIALYKGDYRKASVQLATSLRESEEKLTTDQSHVADAAFFLGKALFEEGRYAESVIFYERCLQLRPSDSIVQNNLAMSLTYAGKYDLAEPLYRKALEANEENLGAAHLDTFTVLNNLAELLRIKGKYSSAEQLYRRALVIGLKTLGPENPYVTVVLNNLALVLKAQDNYAAAEPLYRQALAIREKILKPDDSLLAHSLNNLAKLLHARKDYAGAKPLYQRAVDISERALGPNHPELAVFLNNLGSLLEDEKDFAGAERLYRRALPILEKNPGPDHYHVAICLNNIALLLKRRGDRADAEQLFRRALAIYEKALPPDHPHTLRVRRNLESL
jgi:tetratricopeptide (TPR) repeat protein